jgi:hypothetical protein
LERWRIVLAGSDIGFDAAIEFLVAEFPAHREIFMRCQPSFAGDKICEPWREWLEKALKAFSRGSRKKAVSLSLPDS